jgi:DNA-directed RNA polymerase subunit beta'
MVHDGQVVNKGELIVDGPADPHDILRLQGVEELARYIIDEVQDVYRLQGVKINDKHIEVIVRQMLRRVVITDPGDTGFIREEQVERAEVLDENDKVVAEGKLPAQYETSCCWVSPRPPVDRLLHLGRILPGNDPRADRGCDHGQARRTARPEGKRHRRSPDPGGYRSGLPPQPQGADEGRDLGEGHAWAPQAEALETENSRTSRPVDEDLTSRKIYSGLFLRTGQS